MKLYTLLGADGVPYQSPEKGSYGGHGRTKVYGTMDCPVALSLLRRGFQPRHRVFFADEETAIAAGFRPCGACQREKYRAWKAGEGRWAQSRGKNAAPVRIVALGTRPGGSGPARFARVFLVSASGRSSSGRRP